MKLKILLLGLILLSCNGDMSESDSDLTKTESSLEPTGNFDCGNFIVESGEECDSSESTCLQCKAPRKIFINTSKSFTATEIGLLNLDEICTDDAINNGINGNYTWRAWISKDDDNIKDKIYNSSGLYVSTNYTILAHSFDDLIDGTINQPLILDQISEQYYDLEIWTGTNQFGINLDSNCNNWTSDDIQLSGIIGKSGTITKDWTNFGFGNCGRARFIYCVEDQYIGG